MLQRQTYLVSLIKSDRSGSILEEAAKDKEPLVRIAVASGIHNLSENHANKISDLLINDSDVGIRKVTIKSISKTKSPILLKKIQNVAEERIKNHSFVNWHQKLSKNKISLLLIFLIQ